MAFFSEVLGKTYIEHGNSGSMVDRGTGCNNVYLVSRRLLLALSVRFFNA